MNPGDLQKLLTPAVMDDAEKEFRAWLRHCAEHFEGRDSMEVGMLARLVGFDAEVVYRVLSPVALRGQHIDNVAAMEVFKETSYIESPDTSGDAMRREAYLRTKYLKPLWQDYIENYVIGKAA